MKQIWPTYAYSPTTNVLTLTGLNIDRDQLLLVTAADRGRIMYNFADSSVTASAFTSGANTALTLVATTAGLTTTAALVIYFDDQATSSTVTGTVELGPTSLNALESITVTMGQVTVTGGLTDVQLRASSVTVGGTVTVGNSLTISSLPVISGTVTANGLAVGSTVANVFPIGVETLYSGVRSVTDLTGYRLPISLGDSSAVVSASLSDPLPAGTNRIGVVTIGAGTVTIGAGTAQIGSVTASISGTVPISISSVTVGNSVTISSLPALVAGTAQIGSVTASISNTVVTIYSAQGTTVTNSNFTSTTASTTLVSAVAGRDVLTVFNEGAGNLFISPGATATTISYQVRLSAGDYWECPEGQRSLIHTAVFATAGTARVTEVS
jgi:hypothetical protein